LCLGQNRSFLQYNVGNGLPHETVFSCLEDRLGYMWFCSSNGVARFDGENWKYFTSEDGLPDNDILSLYEDKRGRIWFVSFNGELSYYYNGNIFNADDYPLFRLNRVDNGIASIYEDSNELKWLNPINNFFSSIDDYEFKTYHLLKKSQQVKGFIYEVNKEIYLFTRRTVYLLKDETFIETKIFDSPLNLRSYHYDKELESLIYLSEKGVVQLTSGAELTLLIPIDELPSKDVIGDLYITKGEELWVSTINDGVFIYSQYSRSIYSSHHILDNIPITDCTEDVNGNSWFSTVNNGVYFIPSNYNLNQLLTDKEKSEINNINCFKVEKDGTLWIGSDDGFLFKKTSNSFDKIDLNSAFPKSSIVFNQVNDIVIDGEKLFIATNNGLLLIIKNNLNDITFIPREQGYTYSPKKICVDKNGVITTSHSMGIHELIIDNGNYSLEKLKGIPYVRNYSHTIADDGSVWFVNLNGIHKWSNQTSEIYSLKDIGVSQRVKDITLLNDSTVVCTTNGEGVFIVSEGKLLDKLTKASGLSSNSPSRIKVIDNNIWLCSNQGLDKVIYKDNELIDVINYGQNAGFLTNNINDFYVDSNIVTLCSNIDITFIDENFINKKESSPKVYIDKVIVNGKEETSNNFHIDKDQNITINCSAINFDKKSNIYFQYRLLGLNNLWINTKLKHFEFSSLQPGEYTFQYRAKKLNSDWSEPNEVSFFIDLPFWEQPILIFLYFAVLVVAIASIIIIRTKASNKNKLAALEQSFQIKSLEQKALQAMMNPHFIFNVLNSIQYYLSLEDAKNAQVNLTRFAKLIRKNLEINQEKFISIDDEIEYLELYLSLEKLRFDDSFKYHITVDDDIDSSETNIPTMLIQPFVENAIWHGIMPQEGIGHIYISFKLDNQCLIIEVFDNGIGYDINRANIKSTHKSVGLKMTRERLSLMQGIYNQDFKLKIEKVDEESSDLSGTRVTLRIPNNIH
jgi:sensor histidine kinase YesM